MKIYNQCSDEPIKIPGKIQNFSLLIGLDENFCIQFYSQNVLDLFQIDTISLGSPIQNYEAIVEFLVNADVYKKCMAKDTSVSSQLSLINILESQYYLTIKFHAPYYFLELEKSYNVDYSTEMQFIDFESYSQLSEESLVWNKLAKDICEYIDYDRVMIYQFLEDGSGKVVAESVKNNMEGFLNLHYPEDDIPKQARELYLTKTRRIFSDVDAETIPIISNIENLDLSNADARAMSPIHGQYLRNAGVKSSFSTSIIVNGKLWGLVTCQNTLSKHVDLRNRIKAEIVTKWAAKVYSNILSAEIVNFSIEIDQKISELKERLSMSSVLTEGIIENLNNFAQLADADGIAFVIGDEVFAYGNTPPKSLALKIVEHYKTNVQNNDKVIYDESFAKSYPEMMQGDTSFAGLAIAQINKELQKHIIWFRKEFKETIHWAGNPQKHYDIILKDGQQEMEISPRKSFKVFIEESKGKSKIWTEKYRTTITKLLTLIFEISYDHYTKIKQLNDDLVALNEELDSFSYTISHDLGTPLTVMKLNLQMLGRKLLDGGTKENAQKIDNVLEQINNMENLMRDVLNLSRAKSVELGLVNVKMKPLIDRIVDETQIVYGNKNTSIQIKNCIDITADQTFAYQVFLNLISNAIKYSSKEDFPIIKIDSETNDDYVIYKISDNGIGIPETEKSQMFKIFKRMDNAKSFYGNGVGLNIVYRIMERLQGKIDYENHYDSKGVTFTIQFKK
ncbi:Bacteriophytochrome (light-regulated signal transduction histidine kinase) [Soonwooa buanensis]|uniref:histidine kinase n=1 Tax=Soonwooa buanensis TaxID=619805 RepID=A0A1T5DN51_9FLAO|nr:ATP-binding protein [Soonwooa buanensis]SKB73010.1 Bacteriophytochrome (light-regulated signal transduction histidine kinase) [Soonwooa buanensis]